MEININWKARCDEQTRILRIIRDSCDVCMPFYWDELDKYLKDPSYKIICIECECQE